jgi:phage-related baseplate assembly protein
MSYYMPLTDALNIKDAFVVNIGITYDILVRPNYNSRDVLLACNNTLQDFFEISKWNINQPINISTLYSVLDRVVGVQTVSKIEIVNKQGENYSQYAYDIKGATRNNIVYPSYDTMIFEVKFPNQDIKGRTTSL